MSSKFLYVCVLLLSVSVIAINASSCSNVNIIPRSGWAARSPTNIRYLHNPVPFVIIHHTAWSTCNSRSSCSAAARQVQNLHMNDNGWADIGYSFLVGGDGNIYEGRGWDKIGAHTRGYNNGYAISFMGDYSSRLPSSTMLNAVKKWIDCGISLGKISSRYRLYGHRDLGNTACPGDALYREISGWSHFFKHYA